MAKALTEAQKEKIIQSEAFKANQELFIMKTQKTMMNKDYFKNNFKKDLLFIILSAFLTVIAFDYFISSTGQQGIYPGGLGSIARFMSVIIMPGNTQHDIQMQATFYYVWYIVLNIPFMIFGFWKLGFRFSFTTIMYMVLQIAFDQILTHIPAINPGELHMIINLPLLASIGEQWNSAIWLFIFAIFGGLLIGVAYSFVYKADSSSGGTDFLTVFFSMKKNTNVGTINRNANFLVLGIVVIINTALMMPNAIDSNVKLSVLSNMSNQDAINFINYSTSNDLITNTTWYHDLGNMIQNNGDIKANATINNDAIKNYLINASKDDNTYKFWLTNISKTNIDGLNDLYSTKMINMMRFEYIFGPSLFSSIVFIITQSLVINAMYPKYKVRTYMITTQNAEGLEKVLLDNGYRNNIIISEDKIISADSEPDEKKKVMTLTMTVVNWRSMRRFLYETDEKITVNVLRTKGIEGKFDYEIRNDHLQQYIYNEIINDKKLMKKIDRLAFDKTRKDKTLEKTENK